MAEGARLESVCTATYREFESLTHRHIRSPSRNAGAFCIDKIKTVNMALNLDRFVRRFVAPVACHFACTYSRYTHPICIE